MKQSELDRDIKRVCKLEAKKLGWKSVGGFAYWTMGPLFFVAVTSASAKEGSFYCSLRFKWLALDRELWRVLGMSENEQAPFSLHANGAFVLTGQEILSSHERHISWEDDVLVTKISLAYAQADQRAKEVASEIKGLDSYIEFIQREHAAFMQRFPRAVVNVHKEELLVALAERQFGRVQEIALTRIKACDTGGFASNGKSFYENALAFCRGDA
jgi:hypothetical protein